MSAYFQFLGSVPDIPRVAWHELLLHNFIRFTSLIIHSFSILLSRFDFSFSRSQPPAPRHFPDRAAAGINKSFTKRRILNTLTFKLLSLAWLLCVVLKRVLSTA